MYPTIQIGAALDDLDTAIRVALPLAVKIGQLPRGSRPADLVTDAIRELDLLCSGRPAAAKLTTRRRRHPARLLIQPSEVPYLQRAVDAEAGRIAALLPRVVALGLCPSNWREADVVDYALDLYLTEIDAMWAAEHPVTLEQRSVALSLHKLLDNAAAALQLAGSTVRRTWVAV